MSLDRFRIFVALFLAPAWLGAQNYTVSTLLTNPQLNSSTALTSIWIGNPDSVTADAGGNLYFTSLHSVFRVSAAGQLVRFAGSTRKGFSGDGGQANAAQLFNPAGVAVDSDGNVYIADSGNHRIRRVTPDGIIATVAGSGVAGFAGDSGPAVAASLDTPAAVAADGNGQLFVLDFGNNRVRRVSSAGIITSFAGTGAVGISGDNGPPLRATFNYPTGMTLTPTGELLLADAGNNRIRRIANGVVTSVSAGSLNFPDGVRADSAGSIFISDSGNFRIVKVTRNGIVSIVAGTGSQGFSGDGGGATAAALNYPNDVAIGADGTIYIADSANSRIRGVSPTGIISTLAGSDTAPQIYSADSVAVNESGTVYYTDSFRNQVFALAPGGAVTRIAGDGTKGFSGNGSEATAAQLSGPLGLALDNSGNLYIADTGNHAVRRVTPGGVITTPVSSGLNFPTGVAIDNVGNLFIADSGNSRVVQVAPNGTTSTIAANARGVALDTTGNLYVADQASNRVRRVATSGAITTVATGPLKSPAGLSVDKAGNLFIADSGNHLIRRVAADGTVTTLGSLDGYGGDTGPAALSRFSRPLATALDATGNLYVADSGNSAIRVLRPSAQAVTIAAVVDAASGVAGPLSPGKIVVLYGTGLGPEQLVLFPGTATSVPTLLGGTAVSFSGIPAPVIYTSANQVAAVVPYALNGTISQVTVTFQGQSSLPATVQVRPASPGIFTANSSGAGQAAAINVADGTLNTATAPVRTGDYVALFATGEGLTSGGVDGRFAGLPLPAPLANVSATVGGLPATVQYAGAVFGAVAGLMQINVRIPEDVQVGGYVPVSIQVGDVVSQPGVWISVLGK